MSDFLIRLHRNPVAAPIAKMLGLPKPVELARAEGGYVLRPFQGKRVLLLALPGGFAQQALGAALESAGADVLHALPEGDAQADIVVCDASGCHGAAGLRALYEAFKPAMRRVARNARVLLVAASLDDGDVESIAAARGVEGFTRSLGKELGFKGVPVNLAYVERGAIDRLDGVLRFFCGVQSTYVSGQAFRVRARVASPKTLPYAQALAGKVALVTGSARGIGLAAAERLVQEGARVVCLDIPAASEELQRTCARIGATPLALDIGAPDAPQQLAQFLQSECGGVDILIHNAGITRDRKLANMKDAEWDQVLNVNFASVVAIDRELLSRGVVRDEGRIVCLSSISGVAGNVGQTNYAASKAALIGYVAAQAPLLAARGICINAVAPGFIETAMTDAMPFIPREIGRRFNSLLQGGRPRDVAELIAFLATPGASGISGETIRVCGQGMIGA